MRILAGGSLDVCGNKRGDQLEPVVTRSPKAGIAENFERIQSGDHSNLLGK